MDEPENALTLQVPWSLQAMGDLLVRLETHADQQGWSPALTHKAMLVVEELVVNAISYGDQQPDAGKLEARLQAQSDGLHIDIRDNGRAFDPFSQSAPDIDADLDSRQVGGLGIFLTKELSSSFHYERKDGLNHVHLCIQFDV